MATRSTVRRPRTKSTADPFDRARALATNLWWTWNPDAKRLFESLDPRLWRAFSSSPQRVLDALPAWRKRSLAGDPRFLALLDSVEKQLAAYLRARTWHDRAAKAAQKHMHIAYFCMEYGLHESLPLYSGGLGILAGDHLKSASDLGVPLTGIGMLWRYGYYRQEITPKGETRVLYPPTDFKQIAAMPTGKSIRVDIGGSRVTANLWQVMVGRVRLVLLDTDIPENSAADRKLTHYLYGGDREYRIRQEMLLGIGGVMALDALKIKATVHHLNEGHAAFAPLELVRRHVKAGRDLGEAIDIVRRGSVFTTHTPVPAGNDRFDIPLFDKFMGHYARPLGLTRDQFHALGREDIADTKEPFCMTVLALNLAQRSNGVAELHGDTSRKMWMKAYGVTDSAQVPIGHITNGVHPETWIADEARPFYTQHLKPTWNGAAPGHDWWAKAGKIPQADFWNLRNLLRKRLIAELRTSLREQLISHHEDQDTINELFEGLSENALTIGFARRFAPYKRAPLIFRDEQRLARILGRADRPVQIVYAGKAHPMDKEGQEYVKRVTELTRKAPFRGKVWILQNYDTAIGRLLTQGCDVWLNNPIRPLEASGTSGMKPPLNGGLNCSVLDGWWPEAYNGRNGWEIGSGKMFTDPVKQDAHDAAAIYRLLEREIVPLFYDRSARGIPQKWVKMAAESMRSICCQFSSHRMVAEYTVGSYWPANAGE